MEKANIADKNNIDIKSINTAALINELKIREAVQKYSVSPYIGFAIEIGGKKQQTEIATGPCQILLIWD